MPTYPWQINQPSLAEAFAMGQRLRLANLENERAQQKQAMEMDAYREAQKQASEMRNKLPGALEKARGGDPTELMLLNPKVAEQFMGAQDFTQKRAMDKMGLLAKALPAMKQSPQGYDSARAYLLQTGMFGEEELPQFYSPEAVGQIEQAVTSMAGIGAESAKPTPLAMQVAEALGYGTDISTARQDPKFAPLYNRLLEGSKKGASVNVSVNTGGKMQVEKGTKKELETSLIDDQQMMSDLQTIQEDDPEKYLGAWGRFKSWSLGKMDYVSDLSPESEEFLTGARQLIETTEAVFNQYRKYITGAAASEAELTRLREAMINRDLSPTVFKASLKRIQDKISRAMRIKRRVLREGIDVSEVPMSDQGKDWQRDINPRLTQLLGGPGATPDMNRAKMAANQMVLETYWTRAEADDWMRQSENLFKKAQ